MVLYGKNSVYERLKVRPESIRKIFLQDNFNMVQIEKSIKTNGIAVERLSSRELGKIKHADNLQGIIARVDKFEYDSFDDFLGRPHDEHLTLIFLDRIFDPQNLGAIIRTAACFGELAVVIPKHKACEVNETALHVAAGGENYVPVSMVSNLSTAIIAAKECGYWIMGTVVDDDADDINKVSLTFPIGLVLGSEGEGIRYGLQKYLDIKVRIPMRADISFNVTAACAIFCNEISRQKAVHA